MIWSILTQGKKGHSHHPETLRGKGILAVLYRRYELLVAEMLRRRYLHKSPLNRLNSTSATGKDMQDMLLNSYEEQIQMLHDKRCECRL